MTVARNRAIDRLRRSSTHRAKLEELAVMATRETETDNPEPDVHDSRVPDERIRLIFTGCHPALAMEARVVRTLRTLTGKSTAEIARAFLVPEATVAKRLVRAKHKIANERIPYRVPRAGGAAAPGGRRRTRGYYLLPATRADFLRRLGRNEEAASAYEEAAALAGTGPERRARRRCRVVLDEQHRHREADVIPAPRKAWSPGRLKKQRDAFIAARRPHIRSGSSSCTIVAPVAVVRHGLQLELRSKRTDDDLRGHPADVVVCARAANKLPSAGRSEPAPASP